MSPSLRLLVRLWVGLLAAVVIGIGVLQYLGPPPLVSSTSPASPATAPEKPTVRVTSANPGPSPVQPFAPGRSTPGPIASPDPALLDPATPADGGAGLPRVAGDGRSAMQVYARGFDRSSRRPRVALLMAGVGLNEADSDDAIRTLPGEITLAFSPYGTRIDRLAETARIGGHEFLVSIPMEPNGYPLNDPGNRALLAAASPEANRRNLDWALGRMAGYAGATGALGLMRGERFAALTGPMGDVLGTLARRGLLYVDPRPGSPAPSLAWGRSVDLIVDEPAVRADIEAKLAALEDFAREHGSALGLVTAVRPVTTERIAAWSRGLAERGFVLAPVSAVMNSPPTVASAAPSIR